MRDTFFTQSNKANCNFLKINLLEAVIIQVLYESYCSFLLFSIFSVNILSFLCHFFLKAYVHSHRPFEMITFSHLLLLEAVV